ncbi:DUF2771 domain-containing protein [Streptomyces sp. H27-D2]|uniref:DUF2771 domain-containing protein n=1 Tax=Streptomyces sp. H27-D2 TaxID=3046304 RepID=UPI002DC00FDE|nr:DUF2771 domain-containing protein [Streptomyces sp. H27-D2]MEC4020864.1 DUF2771 domain-containing protein [Streptomyces sp. H27-D2]
MTAAFSSGKGRRAAAALGAVTLGLLTLSACEKPTPLATATLGTTTVTTEASCYKDGEAIKRSVVEKCLNEKAEHTITVKAGEKVRIGVDPKIADTGWMLTVNGRAALEEISDQTYVSLPGAAFFTAPQGANGPTGPRPKEVQISVIEVHVEKGKPQEYKGVWHLKLKRDGA